MRVCARGALRRRPLSSLERIAVACSSGFSLPISSRSFPARPTHALRCSRSVKTLVVWAPFAGLEVSTPTILTSILTGPTLRRSCFGISTSGNNHFGNKSTWSASWLAWRLASWLLRGVKRGCISDKMCPKFFRSEAMQSHQAVDRDMEKYQKGAPAECVWPPGVHSSLATLCQQIWTQQEVLCHQFGT